MRSSIKRLAWLIPAALLTLPVVPEARCDENVGEKVERKGRDAVRKHKRKARKKTVKNEVKSAGETIEDKSKDVKNKID